MKNWNPISNVVTHCHRLLASTCLLAFCIVTQGAQTPNIVLFLIDDMGIMDTSLPFLTDANGEAQPHPLNQFYRTPSMEKLASQGIRFNQFYAMSVCSPTRISLMTGQNAARHRSTNWINPTTDNRGKQGPPNWNWKGLSPDSVTLPGLLRKQGYRTIHIGKGHFGPQDSAAADPQRLGFDENVGGAAFGAPGSYYGSQNYGWGTRREHHAVPHLERYHGSDTFLSEALTIEAKALLTQSVSDQKPFYLYFSHYAVHAPFESDPRFAAHYKSSGKSQAAQAFATLIEGMDKSLGDILHHLHALGVAEETLILFMGDNGSDAPLGHQHEVACAAPLRGKKGSHYEGGMRVPFIAAWAKPNPEHSLQKALPIPLGKIQTQVANVTDVFPTLLEITGASSSKPQDHIIDGHSLTRRLKGLRDARIPEHFLMHYPHAVHRSNYFTTWREKDWKVIYHTLPEIPTTGGRIQFSDGHYELYHLGEDPYESHNLAQEKPEKLRSMMESMVDQLKAMNAVYPVDPSGQALPPVLP